MQARQRYARVQQDDAGSTSSRTSRASEATQARLRRQQRAEVISTKLHAAVWVGLAAAAIFYSRIWAEVTEGYLVDRTWFNLSLVFMGIFSMITAYLVVYLPYIARIHLEWNVYCPRVIPAATAVSLCAIICLLVAFWPVYGMLTPLLLAVIGMGGLMVFHFVPAL